jgi:hypothetical protein
MAKEKFSQLPTVPSATLSDVICAVQGGISSQETLQQIQTLFLSSINNITWHNTITTPQAMVANNGYMANSSSQVVFTLPLSFAFSTFIYVQGFGSGGWHIAQNAGQNIIIGSNSTTPGAGGFIESTNRYDSILLFGAATSTTWIALGAPQGNITIF